jgi:hypothetical protein
VNAPAAISLETLTPAERRLLQRVAERDACFRNCSIHSAAECERCDAEVRELEQLERKGWVTLAWNHMTHHGEVYAATPVISEVGRTALADCARAG